MALIRSALLIMIVGCNFLNAVLAADITQHVTPSDVQVVTNFSTSPIPMIANDHAYLVYEMYLTNVGNAPLRLANIDIKGVNSIVQSDVQFSEKNLIAMMQQVNHVDNAKNNLTLLPGEKNILFLWLPFDHPYQIPGSLEHRLTFSSINTPQEKSTLMPENLNVTANPSIIIDPPLRGKSWISVNGPSNQSIHRRAYRAGNGKLYFAQRYAIDFVKVGNDGRTFAGDKLKNENYFAYGQNIYAVANGKVVAVKNNIPDNTPGANRAVRMNAETVGGNYVVMDIGYQQYAFYAHLKPGSLAVKVGDTVKKGQIIGKVGNTGNSSEPHLHFHIVDQPTFIYANGLPYVFNKFFQQPSQANLNNDIEVHATSTELTPVYNQLMLENTLVNFEA